MIQSIQHAPSWDDIEKQSSAKASCNHTLTTQECTQEDCCLALRSTEIRSCFNMRNNYLGAAGPYAFDWLGLCQAREQPVYLFPLALQRGLSL